MLQTIMTAAITALLTTAGAFLLAYQRYKHEFRLQFQAENFIRKLLSNENWQLRSFDVIRHHVGGFDDEELRRLLVRAGAVRFVADGREMWGLFDRTHHALEGKSGYQEMLNSVPKDD